MPSSKTKYTIQIVTILAVFFFVLFNLVFKLIIDVKSEAELKKVQEAEKQRIKQEFVSKIDERYNQLLKLYQAGEYEKVIEIIKVFNQYEQSEYKDLPSIKKEIRLFYLKKKLEFIPKINLSEYMKLTEDIDIDQDDSTEVFIRTPRYGQYFYESDLPIVLEGIALSTKGDFSDSISWESDVDGDLGAGQQIQVRLSVGEHRITATGTNGETTGVMETRVVIGKDPDFLKKYRN